MRIGVDGVCWANRRGYGRFAREIVTEMVRAAPGEEFICFVDRTAKESLELKAPNVRYVVVPQSRPPNVAASADDSRSPMDLLRFTRAVARENIDVFFSPSVYTYFPLPPGVPSLVTIHDAIAERFPEMTVPSRRARLFWNAKVWLAIRQARLILTVSEYSRKDIVEVHGLSPTRIRVAREAPATAFKPSTQPERIAEIAAASGVPLGSRWFTYVGGFNPHKYVDLIVRAHARYAHEVGLDVAPHLVLVGPTEGDGFHGSLDGIRKAIATEGMERLVHLPGFMPDEQLATLLSGALGLLLVSAAEGFGLPAVEAAACGCPVIATTESPLPELLDGGGVFVSPGDENAVFDAIRLFSEDCEQRARFAKASLDRTHLLSWPSAAGVALDALREAAA